MSLEFRMGDPRGRQENSEAAFTCQLILLHPGRAAQKPGGRVSLVLRLSRQEKNHSISSISKPGLSPILTGLLLPSGRTDLWALGKLRVLQELGEEQQAAVLAPPWALSCLCF